MSTNLSNQNSSNSDASRPESVEPGEAIFSSIYDSSNIRNNDSPLINNFNLTLQVFKIKFEF
jgi:hypothetical protein